MLLVYNYVLLKMSTWCSKHVENSNNILRINNIQCITLVIIVWSSISWKGMLSKVTAFLTSSWRVTKSGLITLIRKNRPRIRSRKQSPQPSKTTRTVFGMLEETYCPSFCHKMKSVMLLVAFTCSRRSWQTSRAERHHLVTQQRMALHCSSECGQFSEELLGTSALQPYSPDLAPEGRGSQRGDRDLPVDRSQVFGRSWSLYGLYQNLYATSVWSKGLCWIALFGSTYLCE